MEKIGVIGQGFVGSAVREGMKNYYDVRTFDINGNCNEPSLKSLIENVNELFNEDNNSESSEELSENSD